MPPWMLISCIAELARAFKTDGMLAYVNLIQKKEKEIGCRRVEDLEEMLSQCDVVTINCPLHEKTRGLFNKELLSKMKPGKLLLDN